MTYWSFIIIQINIALFYIFYCWLNNKSNHFKFNRFYLLIAPIISIVAPFLGNEFQSASIGIVQLDMITAYAKPLKEITTNSLSILNMLLLIGILISIIIFVISLIRIVRFPKEEKLMTIGKISIYRTSSHNSFSFYNSLFINDRNSENLDLIIQHELAHCKQKHTIDLIYFAFIKSLFWYNPIIYFWIKKMKENHEYLADQSVLDSNVEFETYANTILSSHFNSAYPHLATGFNAPSLLKKRIKKMKLNNKTYMKHLILIPVLAGGLFATTSLSNQNPTNNGSEIVQIADNVVKPEFPGGQTALFDYMGKNIKYPKSSLDANEKGMAYIQFTVKKSGEITDVKVLQTSGFKTLDMEAIRVISAMPNWIPGSKNGKTADTEMQLPINFTFND